MSSWLPILILIAIGAAIWFALRKLKAKLALAAERMSSLVQQGIATTGRISAAERRRRSRGEYDYFVTYSFEAKDGSEYSKELRVKATEFDDYTEGQPIDLVYLPNNPDVSATREMVDKIRNQAFP